MSTSLKRMRSIAIFFVLSSAIVLILPAPAAAQGNLGFRGFGIRAGGTTDPDQFHFGVHLDAGEFHPNVRFQPSFEFGIGDNVKVGTFNIDAIYLFSPRSWRPYAGGGLGLAFVSLDSPPFRDDDLRVEAGLNLLGGIEWQGTYRYFVEARVGVGDLPDFKVTAGITF